MFFSFIKNYIARHQNRSNQMLHMIGVPMTFVVPLFSIAHEDWQLATAAFVGGYVLQFLGHAIEGNDAGEVILLKRLLGLSYREFGPQASQGNFKEQSKSSG